VGLAGLTTWALATRYYPAAIPGWSAGAYWVAGALAAFLIFVSVLAHEIGHLLAAAGEKVPVTSVTLLVFGGVTRISQKPPTARADLRIALAGPLASLALSGLFAGLAVAAGPDSTLGLAFRHLLLINLLLATSNMLPAFPLDGGRALRAVLWHLSGSRRDATWWASRAGQGMAVGSVYLAVLWVAWGGLLSGLVLALMGLYFNRVSKSSLKQLRLQEVVAGVRAGDVALDPCLTVPGDLPVARLVAARSQEAGPGCFVVTEGGHPQGLITAQALAAVSPDGGDRLAASQIMTPVAALAPASVEDDVWTLLESMVAGDQQAVLVADRGRPVGVLTRDTLWSQIRQRGERAGGQ
jgi:Zn-dependent protease/predicted transcriptional regulator